MRKKDPMEEVFEFRINFLYIGSDFVNQRYFIATHHSSALEMFHFATGEDTVDLELISLEKWNRWANRWEPSEEIVDGQVGLVS